MNTKKKKIDLNDLIDAANGKGFTPEQLAGVALLLSEYRGEIDQALESLKGRLRTWAVSTRKEGESHLMFKGKFPQEERGQVQVTFMEPLLRLKKGIDPETIEGLVDLLDKRVSYSTKKEIVALLGSPEYSGLCEHFDIVEPKPRVGFRKPKG